MWIEEEVLVRQYLLVKSKARYVNLSEDAN